MAKRALDIVVSSAVLLLLSPLLLLIAIAVIADSGLPVFYWQDRIGRDFRRFRIVKFRSMRTGPAGPKITVAGDSRVTRAGRILRATKLDELPQFWNVLRGEMSLVGPRPEVPEYVELFRERYRSVLSIRPGITDLASVEFRDEEELLARAADPYREYIDNVLPAKLDLADKYVKQSSFALDLSIMCRTFTVILRKS